MQHVRSPFIDAIYKLVFFMVTPYIMIMYLFICHSILQSVLAASLVPRISTVC